MSQEDVSRVKKSILMRYPASFLEEVSRALIGYKSHRDNKQYYRALPILDTLIDYVTLDPMIGKRIYELTEQERKDSPHHFIYLPKSHVEAFRSLYHGPRKDGKLPLRYLAPGKTIDPSKGIVTIRKPVNFIEAWAAFEPDQIIALGKFYYKETQYRIVPNIGLQPVEVSVPTIDFNDPNLKYHETDTIPYHYWTSLYDSGWSLISPVCTMIEKIIAEALEDAGYNPTGRQEQQQQQQQPPQNDNGKDNERLRL